MELIINREQIVVVKEAREFPFVKFVSLRGQEKNLRGAQVTVF
jgi:hypothetical protein